MLVSVIIPAYRAQGFIARAVRSALAQTYAEIEIIIISDDSVDYAPVLASHNIVDSRIRFTSTGKTGSGCSHPRNVGLGLASGRIAAVLDADDSFNPRKLERMVPVALEYGICNSALDYVQYHNGERQLIETIGAGIGDCLLIADQYLPVHCSTNATVVWDRARIGQPWREDVEVLEDLLFVMGAFDYVTGIYHIDEALHDYVYSPVSMSASPGAPSRFIKTKQLLCENIDQGTIGIADKNAVIALRRFLSVSMQAERAYEQALKTGEDITFTALLRRLLQNNP